MRLVMFSEDGRHHVHRPTPVDGAIASVRFEGVGGYVELHQGEHPSATVLGGREWRSPESAPRRVVVKPQAPPMQSGPGAVVLRDQDSAKCEALDVGIRVLHARLAVGRSQCRCCDAQEGEESHADRHVVH